MPEEESSLLLIKNPPSRVTIQLEGEVKGKRGGSREREWKERKKRRKREQGDSER